MTWLSPRTAWFGTAIVLLFAAGGVVAAFLPFAFALSALFCAWIVADALTAPRAKDLLVRRIESEPFALRHPAELRYEVRNGSAQPVTLGLIESPSTRLRFEVDELAFHVAPRAQAVASRAVTPVSRGREDLSTLYVWFEHPLGALRRRMRVQQRQEIRVYPDLSAVERYGTLHARNRLIEAGLRRMRLRGIGTEVESVREFETGDAFRAINWKATARRGRLLVSQYEVERSQNVMLLLDAGRLMTAQVGDQRKFDYAVTAALSVSTIAALANDKIGLVAFAADILRAYAPRSGGRSSARIASELYDLEPVFEEADYERAFAYARSHVNKRSLVLFFTDMVDPVAQSSVLAQIGTLSRRHLVVCVFMNDAAIERAIAAAPVTMQAVFETGVALELRDERRAAAAVLTRMGVRVVDVPAPQLTTALIDQYLQIKQRGLL
ncbi:MAG TPA: DUF58 domain-containing protein [Candidatus Baltobacteraceae bacterium]|nr:DUF58 domain-containing protein [Candidatus Baltobacteraceae bacterium]